MKSGFQGYYRTPTISGDVVVFVSDDDLWMVAAEGGLARRLTSNVGHALRPVLSPDAAWLAYISTEEGAPELYVMPAMGGPAQCLTHLGSALITLGWDLQSERILFASGVAQAQRGLLYGYSIKRDGTDQQPLPTGPLSSLTIGPQGGMVIGRGAIMDPAWWKRYRGGRMGVLWIDQHGTGQFRRLVELDGNLSHPMWIQERIYFQSDHEGIGNIYSCTPTGQDLQRHTAHNDFYVRCPRSDGTRIVYQAGAELYLYDPQHDHSTKIAIDFRSPRTSRKRKFVETGRYLQNYDLHPQEDSLALTVRGRPVSMGCWEGAVWQYGVGEGRVRYRLTRWLSDGQRLVTISDDGGEEALEIFTLEQPEKPKRLDGLDIGRAVSLQVSPVKAEVLLANNRGQLLLVDLEQGTLREIDHSPYAQIHGHDYAADGAWVAYSCSTSLRNAVIRLYHIATGTVTTITEPFFLDVEPCFDPQGRYLYFISYSAFEAVFDRLEFNYGFPRGNLLKLITLQQELPSPLLQNPSVREEEQDEPKDGKLSQSKVPTLQIDLANITQRVVTLPVPPGNFSNLAATADKLFFLSRGVEPPAVRAWLSATPASDKTLKVFDLKSMQEETWLSNIADFRLGLRGRKLVYRTKTRLRVIKTESKPDKNKTKEPPGRKSGWIDLKRVRIAVTPLCEWQQMYRESWRLLRDQYYIADMGGCDWDKVYQRYKPLLARISTRRELSDLIWEMGGELGTSHCYEIGGDYAPTPRYPQGFLGADLQYQPDQDSYVFTRILKGEPGRQDSPLNGPGINIRPGDSLLAINGRRVGPAYPPEQALINQGDRVISLQVCHQNGSVRTVLLKALNQEQERAVRYSDWVRANRAKVHQATNGQIGYVHMSDMGPTGFAQFHAAFGLEVQRAGLIVDVRFNGGGHIAALILDRLARKKLGARIHRWQVTTAAPPFAIQGPLVALTNEFAGSNADIFCHQFQQLGLGTLVGTRTWGGVVGLSPRHALVDNTMTTQPEHFCWSDTIGFELENRGAIPDVIVEITPQQYHAGQDPQLDKAIAIIMEQLQQRPPLKMPDLKQRPDRSLPQFPI